ncbi:hypothetical protein IU479_31160 [Nocardia abscessus]|uniref:hypothetical protein n=1 Tax=Nocardia TaxID=1817 RepID=UPI0018946DEE|nr:MULTISPECIES: hypothetical protein [Nocardia]MBF6222557.1 hypothetical protein [Nocardia abscessus]
MIDGPRLRIPARDYLLFRGPLSEAGQWAAADLLPLPWTGIAGTAALIEELRADASPDVEEIEQSSSPPYRR